MTTAKEAQANVSRILADANVKFSARYLGEKTDAFSTGSVMDEWKCAFTRAYVVTEFQFFTGVGLRKPVYMGRNPPRPGCVDYKAWIGAAKPQASHPAEVLYSLLLDASSTEQSFEHWCADLGYDSDSRKALGIYEACQQNADKLRRVFNPEQIAQLEASLQEY